MLLRLVLRAHRSSLCGGAVFVGQQCGAAHVSGDGGHLRLPLVEHSMLIISLGSRHIVSGARLGSDKLCGIGRRQRVRGGMPTSQKRSGCTFGCSAVTIRAAYSRNSLTFALCSTEVSENQKKGELAVPARSSRRSAPRCSSRTTRSRWRSARSRSRSGEIKHVSQNTAQDARLSTAPSRVSLRSLWYAARTSRPAAAAACSSAACSCR